MRVAQSGQVFEQQLGHFISHFIGQVGTRYQNISDRHRRYRFRLPTRFL